jgi:exopolyphosphatase / guanosine-5'-triphosphate,3'-diphosphate pyrophosphatase
MIVGFIDIGSNAARLLVAELGARRRWRALEWAREPLRLGARAPRGDGGAGECTDPGEAGRLLAAARLFVARCRDLGAADVVAVATSAVREAPDRDELIRRLRQEAGLAVTVLSGEEEARLVYRGLAGTVDLKGRRALAMDIGGGSTEVAVGEGQTVLLAASLPVGAVRLSQEQAPADADGRMSEAAWRALCERVREAASPIAGEVRRLAPEQVFGGAGTMRSLIGMAGREVEGALLSREEVDRLAGRLRRMTQRERVETAGMFPDRADVIVAGAAVLLTIMDELGLPAVRFAAAGVREGLVQDYLARLA